jgi:hypothetical protein
VLAGCALGAAVAARIPARLFEQIFAGVMLLLLVPLLRGARLRPVSESERWSPRTQALAMFAIGIYGGAVQAGVGLLLLFALNHAGFDLVRANAIKLVIATALALVAVPVFVLEQQVAWLPAALVSVGYTLGATAGVRIAVAGGERVIRRVLAVAVVALSARMLGLY